MAKETPIEWCDSVLNLQMGCDGCELWNPAAGVKHCYAGTLTERYGGRKGYPESFDKPALFLDRLDAALRWPDLTGRERPDKPWLNGRPRIVFLNDMGDTFTESLPLDWLAPMLPRLADSPHRWLILTKRPKRMVEFSRAYPLPANCWPGTSVTSKANEGRAIDLLAVQGGGVKWLSVEPLLGPVDPTKLWLPDKSGWWNALDGRLTCKATRPEGVDFWAETEQPIAPQVDWVVIGGESGHGARPCDLAWVRSLVAQCRAAGVACFTKQMGSNPYVTKLPEWYEASGRWHVNVEISDGRYWLKLRDPKGGDPAEWPADLRIRQFPESHHAPR